MRLVQDLILSMSVLTPSSVREFVPRLYVNMVDSEMRGEKIASKQKLVDKTSTQEAHT